MSAKTAFRLAVLVTAALLLVAPTSDAAPFFDAIYAALSAGSERSYDGYNGYSGYGYPQGRAHGERRHGAGHQKQPERTYKDICRVQNSQTWITSCPWN